MRFSRSRNAAAFTFIVHARDVEDAERTAAGAFLRSHCSSRESFIEKLPQLHPTVLSEVRFGFDPVWGELMGLGRLPEQMISAQGAAAVQEAVEAACARGSRVIGLGALTSPATGGGLRLLRSLPAGKVLTNGNAYTAAVVRQNVRDAVARGGFEHRPRVAVVGCTGSVGVPASKLLDRDGHPLTLIGRSVQRARKLLPDLSPRVRYSGSLADAADCGVVVLLTSDETALLAPQDLAPGSLVIDCAQPSNIGHETRAALARCGVRVRDGGLVCIPRYRCRYDFRLESDDLTFACLAETYLFARAGITRHSVGRPQTSLAEKLAEVASGLGVEVPPLSGLENPSSAEASYV